MKSYWAKPDQSYEEHIALSYAAWRDTVTALSPLIQGIGHKYGFSEERFRQSSLLTVVLHDIGKLTEPFQRMMEAARKKERFDYQENYRHELASFPFVIMASIGLLNKSGPLVGKLPLDALSVVAHHKRLNPDLVAFERERRLGGKVKFYEQGIQRALKLAEDIFAKEGFIFPLLDVQLAKGNSYQQLSSFLNNGVFEQLLQGVDREGVRSVYALLKGILHYADWHASGKAKVNYSLDAKPDAFVAGLKSWCTSKNITFSELRPFQQECAATACHVIAVAPTGSGKTEAALLWALNNLREKHGGKLIYLLPTMVTANSIFLRLKDYFGENNVGLTHSTASFMFEREDDAASAESVKDKRNYLFDKTFIRPATVATIDQLLTAGFNTGKWTLLETNAANAVIIIDEIHSYDAWTLGLIQHTIKHFAALGARFMIMSATLPASLIQLLQQVLPSAKIVKEQTLLGACRNHYEVEGCYIEESLSRIEDAVKRGLKTLVVVNNVKQCQDIFNKLSHLNPLCYHSKFILKDRFEKEKNIDKAHLLIATQVVEVSLDIDFDIMFTECAPPDAIAQRAGRINRRRNRSVGQVVLFKPSDVSKKIYDPAAEGLLERSYKAFQNANSDLTEADILNIVESVYGNRGVQEAKDYKDAYEQYHITQSRLMGIFDNLMRDDQAETTRRVDYLQIPVIPSVFKDTVLTQPLSRRHLYEVKMPYWYVRKHKDEVEEIVFCEMNYNSDIGATFAGAANVASFII